LTARRYVGAIGAAETCKTLSPIASIQRGDHHSGVSLAGRVDKVSLTEIDPHMGVGMVYMEEYQIARTLFTGLDAL
jgi:hypothetical protein